MQLIAVIMSGGIQPSLILMLAMSTTGVDPSHHPLGILLPGPPGSSTTHKTKAAREKNALGAALFALALDGKLYHSRLCLSNVLITPRICDR